jgi:hypothetical protein
MTTERATRENALALGPSAKFLKERIAKCTVFEISEVRNGCSEAAQRARWAKVRARKKKAA